MRNYVQYGDTLRIPAPYDVTSGQGVLVGSIFGVATQDALTDGELPIQTRGVYELVKAASQAWTIGARIYWDDATRSCTTTATGNKLIGVATTAVGGGASETIGRVRLNGSFTQ